MKSWKLITMVICGHVLEMYDLVVYGYCAKFIGHLFFPAKAASTELMAAYGLLAASYLMRPIGAYFLGKRADEKGRKDCLLWTLYLMTAATVTIAFIPSYASIGYLAPLLLIICKSIQSFSFGGEYTTVIVYLLEQSPPKKRYFYASFATVGAHCGWLLGSVVCFLLSYFFGDSWFAQDGWRIAFILGAIGGLVSIYWRKQMQETKQYLTSQAKPMAIRSIKWSSLFINLNLCAGMLAFIYLASVYDVPLLVKRAISFNQVMLLTTYGHILSCLLIPLLGWIMSKTQKNSRFIIAALILSMICVWPYYQQLFFGTIMAIYLGKTLFLFSCVGLHFLPIYLVDKLPEQRGLLSALAYHCAAAIYGGATPWVVSKLTEQYHQSFIVCDYFCLTAIISLITLYFFMKPKQVSKAANSLNHTRPH